MIKFCVCVWEYLFPERDERGGDDAELGPIFEPTLLFGVHFREDIPPLLRESTSLLTIHSN